MADLPAGQLADGSARWLVSRRVSLLVDRPTGQSVGRLAGSIGEILGENADPLLDRGPDAGVIVRLSRRDPDRRGRV